MQSIQDLSNYLDSKSSSLKIELDLQSPYQPDGSIRTDLPTGEVLAWDGEEWFTGRLFISPSLAIGVKNDKYFVTHVVRFAPLPTIIEQDDLL